MHRNGYVTLSIVMVKYGLVMLRFGNVLHC